MQWCCGLGGQGGSTVAVPPACAPHRQDAAAPCPPPRGGLCVLLSSAGRSSLFTKPLKTSGRESQEGRNAKGPADAIGGSSNTILQCKIAAKLCWRCRGVAAGEREVPLVLPTVFPLWNLLTWPSQQGGTELCFLSEILGAAEGCLKRSGGKR